VASHDLQEPVRKISTFAGRLKAKYGDNLGEEGGVYLKRMQNASENMQTLLEDLLNFSRLSFSDKPFEKVALQTCLENAISDLEVKIEETKTRIDYQDLPTIEGHATQLKQLFINIIGNAIKFRKPDEVPIIKITCTRINPYSYPKLTLLKNTHYTKIDIIDNGIGFEEEFVERIFMIFQRLNSKTEYSGSGIGLSICKKIVENHYGHIYATSKLGEGSKFTVLLPYTIS
jgi:light-regulated signal transduction histidine kinase (bacteriophytochrome)